MKLLLLLAMTVAMAAAAPESRASLCPSDVEIYPCICSEDDAGQLNLDCSEVTSNIALANVFQADFPETHFYSLLIAPTVSHPPLTTIESNVFGEVSFELIYITNTYIYIIEEEAFSPSHDSLIALILNDNNIEVFPAETVPLFVHLRILNLANNRLSALPSVESSSLNVLNISGNVGLTFNEDTFSGAPVLEELYLQYLHLASLPANVFSSLNFIRVIDLSQNYLGGELQQGVLSVPLDSLEDLRLNNNAITQIHPTAITGVDRTATFNFSNNEINSLDKDNWSPLLDQIIGAQVVDLRNNPLACYCDLVWLLLDSEAMDKIHDDTTCINGDFMKETNVNDLLLVC